MTQARVSSWCAIGFDRTGDPVTRWAVAVSFALLVAVGQALAGETKTFFVDSQAGNDSASGTAPSTAWKSLGKVNKTTFSPGEKILFKSGATWTGQLWPKGSGSATAPIVVDKYGAGPTPIINAAGLTEDAVLLKNQEYWEIQNLEITNGGPAPAVRRGVHLVADNVGDMHHLYLRSLTVHAVNGVDSEKVNGGIHYSAIGDSKPSRFVDLRIEDNHIYHVDRSGIFGWSTHWTRSKWYPSLGVVVRGNMLDDIGGDGIVVVATDGALIEHNVVSNANQRSQGYNDGIWPWSADNTVVQFNEVYGMRGQRDGLGFDSDWNSRNTIIQYNYSHDNEGGFLLICNDGSQTASDSVGNLGTIVRYNISQNDHHRGINISGPVKDATVYNNTIYVGKNENVSLLLYANWTGWSDGMRYYNNIFYVDGAARFTYATSHTDEGVYLTAPGLGPSKNNVFDSNVFYHVAPVNDPDAQVADPLLQAPGQAQAGGLGLIGYSPQAKSPPVNSGKVIPDSGGRDFFGSPVPSCGGVDRGAVELKVCENSK